MTDTAIRVENLSKRYRIGPCERHQALRDIITDVFAAPFRRLREIRNSQFEIRNVFLAAFCQLPSALSSPHASRFTFCGVIPQSAIANRKSQIAHVLFLCLLPPGLSQSAKVTKVAASPVA